MTAANSFKTSRRTRRHSATLATPALAASPLIVPSHVLGLGGAIVPSHRITIGFIGTSRQVSYANVPGFLPQPQAHVVAVCGVNSWRMEKVRQQVDEFPAAQRPSGH